MSHKAENWALKSEHTFINNTCWLGPDFGARLVTDATEHSRWPTEQNHPVMML